ncbi:MAG: hypothetical protein WKF30_16825 [Pyrinomonadaceae bacterium]
MDYTIEQIKEEDWEAVRAIYAEGIATGNATFETEAPSFEEWNSAHLADGRLVARAGDGIVKGWAVFRPFPIAACTKEWPKSASTSESGIGEKASGKRCLIL